MTSLDKQRPNIQIQGHSFLCNDNPFFLRGWSSLFYFANVGAAEGNLGHPAPEQLGIERSFPGNIGVMAVIGATKPCRLRNGADITSSAVAWAPHSGPSSAKIIARLGSAKGSTFDDNIWSDD